MADPKLSEIPAGPLAAALPYLRPIRARPALVAVCAAIALSSAVAYMLVVKPTYEATANIVVNPIPGEDVSYREIPELLRFGFGDQARPIATMALIIEREAAIAQDAAAPLGIDADAVRAAIEVDFDRETNLIEVIGHADSADEAARRANEYVAAALRIRSGAIQPSITREIKGTQQAIAGLAQKRGTTYEGLIEKLNNLSSLSTNEDPTLFVGPEARAPSSPAGIPRPLLLGIAGLVGALIGAAGALAIHFGTQRRLVDSEAAVRELTGTPILGRIPELAGGGPGAVAEAYSALRAQLAFRAPERDDGAPEFPGKTVLVTSAGIGDGRSVVAAGLARAIGRLGGSAYLFELDPVGHGEPSLAVGAPGLAALADGRTTVGEASSAVDRAGTVRHLAWPRGDRGEDGARLMQIGRQAVVAVAARSDSVIIDGPPGTHPAELAELAKLADQILITVRLGHTSGSELAALTEMLTTIGVAAAGVVVVGSAGPAGRVFRSGVRRGDNSAAVA